jgi:hypothetical protein
MNTHEEIKRSSVGAVLRDSLEVPQKLAFDCGYIG